MLLLVEEIEETLADFSAGHGELYRLPSWLAESSGDRDFTGLPDGFYQPVSTERHQEKRY